MKWFKFYGQDWLSDPKTLALSAAERSCWITLLSYGSVNDNGMITFLSEEQLMAQAGISFAHEEWDRTIGVLKKLENLGMIRIDNGVITICNWQKRQETSLTSYERVKRHREKKRNDNAKITLEENGIEENRIDKSSDASVAPAENLKKIPGITTGDQYKPDGVSPRAVQAAKPKRDRTPAQIKSHNVLILMDYFRDSVKQEHDLTYLHREEDRNAKMKKQVDSAYARFREDTMNFIDWWVTGGGAWANYEPEAAFTARVYREYENRDKINRRKGKEVVEG